MSIIYHSYVTPCPRGNDFLPSESKNLKPNRSELKMLSMKDSCHLNGNSFIDCIVFNAVFNVFQLYRGGRCTYLCFPGVLF